MPYNERGEKAQTEVKSRGTSALLAAIFDWVDLFLNFNHLTVSLNQAFSWVWMYGPLQGVGEYIQVSDPTLGLS